MAKKKTARERLKRKVFDFCEDLADELVYLSSDKAARIREERLWELTEEEKVEYDKLAKPGGRFQLSIMFRDKSAPSKEERSRQKQHVRAFSRKLWARLRELKNSPREANDLRNRSLGKLPSEESHDYQEVEKARDKLLYFGFKVS